MRLLLLCLAMAFSGAAALAHQMLWVRLLGQLFGHSVLAVHVVLFVFFAGTGLGAWWFGRVADRGGGRVRLFCALELVLAVWALAFGPALARVEALYLAWDPETWTSARALAVRAALAALLLAVPTLAMGGTLPAITRAAHTAGARLAGRLGWLYGLNTVGAAAGALATVFVVVPRVGLTRGLWLAAAVNVLSAAVGAAAGRRGGAPLDRRDAPSRTAPAEGRAREGRPPSAPVTPASAAPPPRAPGAPMLHAAAGIAGFVAIGAEVVWTRALAARFGGTVFAYALILSAFLLALGIGPMLTGLLDRAGLAGRRACALVPCAAGLALLGSLGALAHVAPSGAAVGASDELVTALSVMGLPALLFGLNLPLLAVARHHDPARLGRDVGTLWLANTVGAVLAPPLVGLVAIPALGLDGTLAVLGATALLFGTLVLVPWAFGAPWPVMGAVTTAAAILALTLPRPDARWHLGPDETLLVAADGVTASLAVVETTDGERLLKLDGHYKLGGTRTRFAQDRQGLLPLLVHPGPRSALMLGVGSGGSVGAAAALDEGLVVDALEIVPEVPALLGLFERGNHGLLSRLRDPAARVELHVGDARHFVRAAPRRYDVIVGDLFVPWNAGEAGMYTREHLAAVRAALAEGGLFVQWLPLYQLRLDDLAAIVATFLDVFPSVEALWLYFNVEQPALGLIAGEASPAWSRAALQARLDEPSRRALLAGADLLDALPILASRCADREALAALAGDAPLERRDRPRVEYGSAALARAGRDPRALDAILDALLALPPPPAGDDDEDGALGAHQRALGLALRGLRTPTRSPRWELFAEAFVQTPEWGWIRLLMEEELLGALADRDVAVLDAALAILGHRPRTRFLADYVAARAALELDGDRERALRLARASVDARPDHEPALRLVASLEEALGDDR